MGSNPKTIPKIEEQSNSYDPITKERIDKRHITSYTECIIDEELGCVTSKVHGHKLNFYSIRDKRKEYELAPRSFEWFQNNLRDGQQFYWGEFDRNAADYGMNLNRIEFYRDGEEQSTVTLYPSGGMKHWANHQGDIDQQFSEYFSTSGFHACRSWREDEHRTASISYAKGRPNTYSVRDRQRDVTFMMSFDSKGQVMECYTINFICYYDEERKYNSGMRRPHNNSIGGISFYWHRAYKEYILRFINSGEDVTDEVLQQVVDPLAITEAEEAMLSIHYGANFCVALPEFMRQELAKVREKEYNIDQPTSLSK